ncbi:MAG: serine/threonine protein kinase, partial [Planctomycetaceae bacterium]|nr:serine/threonine protein kinase [Planctomycetaceae bacterium]
MTEIRQCPQCDAELPADAPEGVCPKCLMQLGFESREQSAGEPGDPTVIGSGFVAPSVEKLAEHFPQLEIIELLGKGGMGAVYKARQPSLDRLVALKILPPEIGKDPAFAERFMREARALAMLNHTCIVAVYDFGEADGLYYFVMEYVDGANLRQTIEAGGLQPKEALAIVPQICDALQFAHEEGVVHRDIKPENVLIDKRGRVKIADFGLAKLLGVDAENSPGEKPFTLTGTNQVMGTLQYMAPEQMRGSHDVDHRADIYSLGVVFYEMLTGELPIGRFQPPSKKVQVDVRLDEVVLRSLESEPERRYQHASDVKKEVESILTTAGILPPAAQSISTADNALVRGRLKVPAIGLLVAGIVNLLATLSIVLIPVVITLLSNGKGMGIPGPTELLVVACSLAMGTMLIAGAVRMFDLQSHRIAVIAAVIAVLPCTLGFLISLPFGIWALIVLSKPDVQDAFAGHGQLPQSPTRVPQSSTMEAVAGKGNAPTAALPAGAGPAPVSSSTWESVPPRFSRKAIWGAAWAPLFFIVAFGSVYLQTVRQVNSSTMSGSSITETTSRPVGSSVSTTTPPPATVIDRQTPSPGPEWWQWVLICTALPLGLAAPFGTTILGTIAISDIRHSQNRLVGLPLAVGDALLFPLLLLDVLICFVVAALVSIGISTIQDVMGIEGSHAGVNVMLPMLVALPMAILVDVLICRAVWRKASRPLHEPTDSETPHGTDEADAVCRQLRGPGIGLVFTGIANWLVLPFLIAMSSYLSLAEPAPGPSATVFGSVAAAIFVFSALMIFSGLRIMRCESRGLGIFAAVLAMIVTPGNVI